MKAQYLAVACLTMFGCSAGAQTMAPVDLMGMGQQIITGGCPSSSESTEEKVVSRYDPRVIDTIKTVSCNGIRMQIYISPTASVPSGLAMNLNVDKPIAQIPEQMNIGQPVERLVSLLGQPTIKTTDQFIYDPDESENTIAFTIEKNQIKSIRWAWYIE